MIERLEFNYELFKSYDTLDENKLMYYIYILVTVAIITPTKIR